MGTGIWEHMLDESMVDRLKDIDAEMARIFTHMRNYQAVRTHFFDPFFAEATGPGSGRSSSWHPAWTPARTASNGLRAQ